METDSVLPSQVPLSSDPEAFADMDKDNAEIVYGEDSEGYDDNQADNVMSLNEDYNEDAASDTEVVEE